MPQFVLSYKHIFDFMGMVEDAFLKGLVPFETSLS